MLLRPLGRTNLTVPVIGMGTWRTFDVHGAAEEEVRARIVDVALESGTNLFDTSPMYGESERVLAAALEDRRDRAIVATKVWTESLDEGRIQIERALEWYGGRVDIYQIHNLVGWRKHLPVLEALREEGRIGIIGATHYRHEAFPELRTVMETGRIQQIQIPYNARDQVAAREILPLAEELGIGVLVMRPLGEGALVRNPPPAVRLEPLRRFGITTWAQALLKWILSDPRVHCVIPATSRVERVSENAAAGDEPLLDADSRAYIASVAAA
jgi:aryl-alcohol dehydrogenase-like predicted oxidoreductase